LKHWDDFEKLCCTMVWLSTGLTVSASECSSSTEMQSSTLSKVEELEGKLGRSYIDCYGCWMSQTGRTSLPGADLNVMGTAAQDMQGNL
jgi:hypothetical protein